MRKRIFEEPKKLCDYDVELRGPAQNRFGGWQVQTVRPLPGGTYGPASPCRICTAEEKAEVAKELARQGLLDGSHNENAFTQPRPRSKRSSRKCSGVRR